MKEIVTHRIVIIGADCGLVQDLEETVSLPSPPPKGGAAIELLKVTIK